MQEWAEKLNLRLTWHTFRQGQAVGEGVVFDMKKRFTNALRDAKLDNSKVDLLLEWLLNHSVYEADSKSNGAKALYNFTKA
jgi:3-oxoacyl-[acyl-carrier-protein] synthase III